MKKEKSASFLDLLTMVLSVYVIVVFGIDTFAQLPPQISRVLTYIDDFICCIFLYDFCLRLHKAENKWSFMKWGWVDLVSSIPALPIMRIGRIFRLFRLLRIFRSAKIIITQIFKNRGRGAIKAALTITILIVILASIGILIVETGPQCNIKTADDAVYWALTTLVSGYSGKFPVTVEGKFIGTILMFTGIGLLGTFTAFVASWFIEEDLKKDKEIEEEKAKQEKTS